MLELVKIVDGKFHIRDNFDNTEEVVEKQDLFSVVCAGINLKGFQLDMSTGQVNIDDAVQIITSKNDNISKYADGVSIEGEDYDEDDEDAYYDVEDDEESETEDDFDEDDSWDDYDDEEEYEDYEDDESDEEDIYYGDSDDESEDVRELDNAVIFDKLQEKYGVKKTTMKEFTRIYSRVAYFRSKSFKERLKIVSSGPNYRKIQAMYNLAGDDEWEYDGCEVENTKCTFGHNISYAHYAVNKTLYEQTGELRTIVFGCVCCNEFFDLDEEGKKLIRSINSILKRLGEEMWNIYESGQKDAYDKSLQPFKDLVQFLRNKGKNAWIWGALPLLEGVYDRFIREGVLLPKPLVYYVLNNLNKISAKDYLELFTQYEVETYRDYDIFIEKYFDDYELAKNFGLSIHYAGLYAYDPVNERNNIKENDKTVLTMGEMREPGGFSLTAIANRLNTLEFLLDSRMFTKQDLELASNYYNHISHKDTVYTDRIYPSKTYTIKGKKYTCGGKGFELALKNAVDMMADGVKYPYQMKDNWLDMFAYYAQTADMIRKLMDTAPNVAELKNWVAKKRVELISEHLDISKPTAKLITGMTGSQVFLKSLDNIRYPQLPRDLSLKENGTISIKEVIRKEARYYFEINGGVGYSNGGKGKYNHRKVWEDLYGFERSEHLQLDLGIEVGKDTVTPFVNALPNIVNALEVERCKPLIELMKGYTEEDGMLAFCDYMLEFNSSSSYGSLSGYHYKNERTCINGFYLVQFVIDRIKKVDSSLVKPEARNMMVEAILSCIETYNKYSDDTNYIEKLNKPMEDNTNTATRYDINKLVAGIFVNGFVSEYNSSAAFDLDRLNEYKEQVNERVASWKAQGETLALEFVDKLKELDQTYIDELKRLDSTDIKIDDKFVNFDFLKMCSNNSHNTLSNKLRVLACILTQEEIESNIDKLFTESEVIALKQQLTKLIKSNFVSQVSATHKTYVYYLDDAIDVLREDKEKENTQNLKERLQTPTLEVEDKKNYRYKLKDEPNIQKALDMIDDWKNSNDERFNKFKEANGGFAYSSIIPKVKHFGNITTNQLKYIQGAFNTIGEVIDLTPVSEGVEVQKEVTKSVSNETLSDELKSDIEWFKDNVDDIPDSVMSSSDKQITIGIINYYESKGTVSSKQLYRIKQISKARQS